MNLQKPVNNDQIKRTARERVTPLADIPYNEQLGIKMKDVKRIAMKFLKEMISAHVNDARRIDIESLVESVSSLTVFFMFHPNSSHKYLMFLLFVRQ